MVQGIDTVKLTDTVGAEVLGVDTDRLLHDEDLPAWTLRTLEANGVLVFRELHLDDATQVAFSKRLGRVEVFGSGEFPEIFVVTLDPAKNRSAPYLRGTFDWHIDGLTDDIPIMATLLSARGVADTGGETEFASTYAAYDDLSEEDRTRFESVRVVHSIEAAQRRLVPDPTDEQLSMWRKRPAKEQPLIWRHRDGRHSVVLGPTADHVVGMDKAEGDALLDDVLARATSPERVYRHVWKVGDLVIWDNRGVLHRALPYDPGSARDMHRTTLHGDEAIS
ncbi:MAG TPA: TauD/TfdA family dioxygenase [Acidimicrobiales bacterium]|nr:TauD/TfdA family dioxygenase [Acidimicrobiales bacterium]